MAGGSTRTTSRQLRLRSFNKLSLDGTIKHLVVVSDPRTLGEMRKHFHRDLRGKIMGEFAKDFSRHPLEDIASLIADA
ncbi:baeRF12 domain-containing protein [Bradyrhizobium elkanii]|uniref:baeRF12 domain-containing protein n=1 Tax=Bradyrhizobium elkanii TaxID=29448 RepID=UPI0035110B32